MPIRRRYTDDDIGRQLTSPRHPIQLQNHRRRFLPNRAIFEHQPRPSNNPRSVSAVARD